MFGRRQTKKKAFHSQAAGFYIPEAGHYAVGPFTGPVGELKERKEGKGESVQPRAREGGKRRKPADNRKVESISGISR